MAEILQIIEISNAIYWMEMLNLITGVNIKVFDLHVHLASGSKNVRAPQKFSTFKPCKGNAYCRENKQVPRLKNHLPYQACNHKSLCALRQHLHVLVMQAHLNALDYNLIELCLINDEFSVDSGNGLMPNGITKLQ